MDQHRVRELLELLEPYWLQRADKNLVELLVELSKKAGHKGELATLTDDVLFYQLKVSEQGSGEIPGLAKDREEDFKTAILRARGLID